jgi:hypothetical protein
MDYESSVMEFIVANGNTFVSPQYPVGKAWSCPDFVAIRPASKECYVVEVSAGWDLSNLAAKVRNREQQWMSKLRDHLTELSICDQSWKYHVIVFVREERIKWFEEKCQHAQDVHVWPLEVTLTPWAWTDDVRKPSFSFIR